MKPIIFAIGLMGVTSVDNMVLLCSAKHKLLHEGGYTVQRDHAGELFFRRPDGKAVPQCGYHSQDQVEAESEVNGPENDSEVFQYLKNSRSFSGDGFSGFSDSFSEIYDMPVMYYCVDRAVA